MKLRLLISLFLLLGFYKQSLAIEFEELTTNKGISFWFVKDSSLPLVSLSFTFRGGAVLDPKNKEGSTNLMVSLLDEGTENFNGNDFKLSLKENGTKISFSAEKDKIEDHFRLFLHRFKRVFGYYLSQLISRYLSLKK